MKFSGKKLKNLRESYAMSRNAFGMMIGLPQHRVKAYEEETATPGGKAIGLICDKCSVKPNDVFDFDR